MSTDRVTHMRSRTIDVQCTLGRKGKAGRKPLGTVDPSGDVLRIPIESRSTKYRQVASAWHVWVRTPAAAEYVRKRQAALMRELDGMCLDQEDTT